MKISYCEGVAIVQGCLALGALVIGEPAIAAAFGVFAAVQVITLAASRRLGQPVCGDRGCTHEWHAEAHRSR